MTIEEEVDFFVQRVLDKTHSKFVLNHSIRNKIYMNGLELQSYLNLLNLNMFPQILTQIKQLGSNLNEILSKPFEQNLIS